MDIEKLQLHELLQDGTLIKLLELTNGEEDELYFKYRDKIKKHNSLNLFNKKYKNLKKKKAREKIEHENFCEFDNEKFDMICTGEWVANVNGIFKQVPNFDTGEVDKIEASRMAMVPQFVYKNIDTKEIKVNIAFKSYGEWHNIVVDKSKISIAHKIVELSKVGLDVTSTNAKNMVDFLYDCLTLNTEEIIPLKQSCSRLGWVGDKFLPYTDGIVFDGEQQNKYLYNCLKSKGNREEWINYTQKLRAESVFLRMQMAASFASPLVEKLNLLPFILHVWGKTGTGKTVGMIVAMSIWGDSAMGKLTKSMNNTINSVMDTCAFMRNLPVALDELQAIKDKMGYDKFVMLLCEGVERGRMKFDEAKETRTWKNSFLFTGEEPVVGESSGGGVFNRVIEVDVTGKTVVNPSLGEEIVEFYSNNNGLIAGEYISNINRDLEEIKNCYKILNKKINNLNNTTTKQAMAMSLLVLGDMLASKYFFAGEEQLELNYLKKFLFTDEDVDVSERAYSFIKDTISMNQNKFDKLSNEIWGKIDETKIYFQKQKLVEILKNAGFDIKALQKTWSEKGYIIKNSQGKYSHNTRINGIKSYFFVFQKEFGEIE